MIDSITMVDYIQVNVFHPIASFTSNYTFLYILAIPSTSKIKAMSSTVLSPSGNGGLAMASAATS